MRNENPELAQTAQRLISCPEVQKALGQPITYDRTVTEKRVKTLNDHGFKVLSKSKPIVEHPDLPGWIIKSGANPLSKNRFIRGPMNEKKETSFHVPEDSLLRIEMADRIAKIAKEENIEVVLPKKRLVTFADTQGITDPTQKYCILSEKLNVLSEENTSQALLKMDVKQQRELAKKISTLVQKTGWVDPAVRNLRLTPEGKLAILDTEPFSLMTTKKPHPSVPRASIEKCARVGLFVLLESLSETNSHKNILKRASLPGLEEFHKQIKSDYEKISSPKLSQWKIALSILSLGAIPLVQSIVAFSSIRYLEKELAEVQKMRKDFDEKINAYYDECHRKLETLDFFEEHHKKLLLKLTPIAKNIEGVPFPKA